MAAQRPMSLGGSKEHGGIWILGTRAGGDLLGNARRVPAGDRGTRVVELDAGAGEQERILFELPYSSKSSNSAWAFTVLTRSSAGGMLLVAGDGGHGYRVDLTSGRHERFPLPGGTPRMLAW